MNYSATFLVFKFKFISIFLEFFTRKTLQWLTLYTIIASYGDCIFAISMDIYHELIEDPYTDL